MLTNKEYAELVNKGEFPQDIKVPLDNPFVDERGIIQNLWLANCGSVTLITSKKGSVRAQHYHQNDWHAAYIVSGSIKYTETDIDGSNKKEYIFNTGEMFFSPPMKWHRMDFLSDTVFLTANGISKNHENYENSVVRKEM